ncbi:MAG: alpha/beta hydrolase [Bacteroidetes bacterium]|nr:alpha/beta hydrolase [Bacteroidota bacterium]MDA0887950.1 alpha/beta hydrolase [Bacteroidota bacterium]MDA1083903.1 alpha/beta hydrolase [Bacteroidota bacterium]
MNPEKPIVAATSLLAVLLFASCTCSNPKNNQKETTATSNVKTEKHQTYLLVHSAWLGGWQWEGVTQILREKGHTVLAPDLPGHGADKTAPGEITMDDYVNKLVKNEDKEFLRIYDPRFSIYSNLVKLHDQNSVVNMEQRTMTLKNKKHNIILEGIDVVNPIKIKKVKIVFHHQHIIKSIKVEPSSIIKEMDENTITFSGEGMENLAYEIEFGFVPYETYEPKKEDLSASTIKLTPDEHYFIFVKSDKGNIINVYVNDMLFSESLPIDQNEKAIPPYVMKNNIIGNVIIENAGQGEANIHLLIKDTKEHTIKQQKFSIKKGIAKKINFEY